MASAGVKSRFGLANGFHFGLGRAQTGWWARRPNSGFRTPRFFRLDGYLGLQAQDLCRGSGSLPDIRSDRLESGGRWPTKVEATRLADNRLSSICGPRS